jgi:hypothetical protein
VATLVGELAADLLQERAAMVASSENGLLPAAQTGDTPSAALPTAGAAPSAPSAPFAVAGGTPVTLGPPRPRRRGRTVAAVLASAVLLAGAGAFLLMRSGRGGHPPVAPSPVGEARAAVLPPPPRPDPAPIPATALPTAPSAVATEAPTKRPALRSHLRPPHSRGKHRRRAASAPPRQAAPAVNCKPPFTIGPDGVKQYKIECL